MKPQKRTLQFPHLLIYLKLTEKVRFLWGLFHSKLSFIHPFPSKFHFQLNISPRIQSNKTILKIDTSMLLKAIIFLPNIARNIVSRLCSSTTKLYMLSSQCILFSLTVITFLNLKVSNIFKGKVPEKV